jgi:hypothetical protein
MAGDSFLANVLNYEDFNNGVNFKLDLTHAYDVDSLELFTRTFEWNADPELDSAYLKLTDSFKFKNQAGSFEEAFISLHQPELKENCVLWQGKAGRVELSYNGTLFKPEIEKIHEINHHGKPREVYRIRLICSVPVTQGEYEFTFNCILD